MAASMRATRPEKQLRKWHEMHALSPPPGQTPLLRGPPEELQTQPRERMLLAGGSSGTDPKDAMVPRPVSLVPVCPFSAPGGAHLPLDSGSVVKMAEVLEKQRRC